MGPRFYPWGSIFAGKLLPHLTVFDPEAETKGNPKPTGVFLHDTSIA
jgi:hypothetical protein